MGYSPRGHKELDMTEQLTYTQCLQVLAYAYFSSLNHHHPAGLSAPSPTLQHLPHLMSSSSFRKPTSISVPMLKMCTYIRGIVVVQSLSGVQLFVIP